MADSTLHPFFQPDGIVLIGASTSPNKLGYGVARNLTQSGYVGAVHFVGQKAGELFRRPVFSDLDQIPDPVDLAILIVPPEGTPKTIEDCGRRGIRAAIVMSSGFREAGAEGAACEQECLDIAHRHGIRLLGPNCIGIIDTHLPLDTTFLQPPMPARGHIGFISQSGAFCAGMIDWSRREGFGFSRIVSLGNQAEVSEIDILSALAEDEHTHVITLYMESVSDGRRFVDAAREVTRRKPIVALKVGRFESGQRAAASHTGALAGSDAAFEAAFEKAGILRAETAEQMFDWARALASYPGGLDSSRRARADAASSDNGIAILTNAGGPGVIAADALEKNGLSLARLHESARKALFARLPPAAGVSNPVDMLASASPETYADCLKILLEDRNVNAVQVILPPPPMFEAEEVAERIINLIESDSLLSASGKPTDSKVLKPIVAVLMGSTLVEEARSVFQRSNIPTYPFPERAASALGALVNRSEFLTTENQSHGDVREIPFSRVSMVDASPQELLAAYGIESAPIRLARSVEEAESMAAGIGYPIVMKIASADILHKSDVGGVVLNIQDPPALHIAYTQLVERIREERPKAHLEGVHLQRQVAGGQEVVVGAVRDPQFGPLMMFGSGGVEVEGLRDVSFALAPLTRAEASKMIRRTWAGQRLAGFRSLSPVDEESVVEVLVRLARLFTDHGSIGEIEINPLKVLSQGAIAVDVRMI